MLQVNNLNPNHRCFDTIYLEGQEQEITAKFFYGPLDALSLVGEKVCGLSLSGYLKIG